MSPIIILPNFKMAPSWPYFASKASVETLLDRLLTKLIGAPLLNRYVKKYISSITKVRMLSPTLKQALICIPQTNQILKQCRLGFHARYFKELHQPAISQCSHTRWIIEYLQVEIFVFSFSPIKLFFNFLIHYKLLKTSKTPVSTFLFQKLELPKPKTLFFLTLHHRRTLCIETVCHWCTIPLYIVCQTRLMWFSKELPALEKLSY